MVDTDVDWNDADGLSPDGEIATSASTSSASP